MDVRKSYLLKVFMYNCKNHIKLKQGEKSNLKWFRYISFRNLDNNGTRKYSYFKQLY